MPVEGRSLSSRATQEAVRFRRLGNLSTPESVQKLRAALHAKAKQVPSFRFYAVTDRHKGAGDDRHNGATYLVGKTDIPVGQEWVDFEPLATRAEAPAGATLGLRRDLPSNSMQ